MRTWGVCVALLVWFRAMPALAAWEDWKPISGKTHPDDNFLAISALSPLQFIVGGVRMSTGGGMIPQVLGVLYRSQDGGELLQDIRGNIQAPFGSSVNALAFVGLAHGVVAIGGDVWVTENGTTWKKVALMDRDSGAVWGVASLGDGHWVAVGSGGRAWRSADRGVSWDPVATGTQADLSQVFFVDDRRGFALGVRSETEQDIDSMQEFVRYLDAVLLATEDGGRSWRVRATIPRDAEVDGQGGKVPGKMFWLPDARQGFVSFSRHDYDQGRLTEVRLFRTTDGGQTLEDMKVDFQVGTLKMMMTIPIRVSYLAAMYWDSPERGHLVGAANTGLSMSGSGGGGSEPVYRTADMITMDGGRTWEKTDIGELTMSFGTGVLPTSDPRPVDGMFLDWYTAWLAGEKGHIWTYDFRCIKQSQCLPGYRCEKRASDDHYRCYPDTPTPPEGGSLETGENGPTADSGAARDASMAEEAGGGDALPMKDAPPCPGDCEEAGRSGGGCQGGAAPGSLLPVLAILWLLATGLRRRAR